MINSQTLFPLIGKVITSAGSRKFTRLLHDLVLTKLHVDATYIAQLRVKDADASRAESNTISYEIQGPACMASPIGSNKQTTEVLTSELLMSECSPVHHMTDCSSVANVGIEQALTTIPFSSQLHLKSLKNEYCYIISLYRVHADSFSTQEQITLKDFSSLLLPLVEKHINAINSQAILDKNIAAENFVPNNANIDSLRQRFENRLMQSGLKLSNREKEICIGLLAGHTAPELADALVLKVNTVESYLKRAVIKMGIRGRHSLIRWMHANPGAAKVASW